MQEYVKARFVSLHALATGVLAFVVFASTSFLSFAEEVRMAPALAMAEAGVPAPAKGADAAAATYQKHYQLKNARYKLPAGAGEPPFLSGAIPLAGIMLPGYTAVSSVSIEGQSAHGGMASHDRYSRAPPCAVGRACL